MSVITKIHARQILDSRGNPTVEVDVTTEKDTLVELQFLLEHLLVSMKQLSCGTGVHLLWVKEFLMP